MASKRKETMISARLPQPLVDRADYVAKNTENDAAATRSGVIREALEAFLPGQEADISKRLGDAAKKV